jgi:hypothetical protein
MHFRDSRRVRVAEVGQITTTRRGHAALILAVPALSLLVPALAVAVASTGGTSQPTRVAAVIARFLLIYSGVFALVALTAAVVAGLLAADRMVMSPDRRILAQALHRTASVIGLCALANHIMLEILAHRARVIDGFVPFMAARSTFYMGLGTLSSDLLIVIIVTGIARRRFTRGAARWVWRGLHATAYAAWPLAILHGLLAGRSAKPYVDWSYGGCLAAVAVALAVRHITGSRSATASGQSVQRAQPQPTQLSPAQASPARLSPAQASPAQPRSAQDWSAPDWSARRWSAQPWSASARTPLDLPRLRALPAPMARPEPAPRYFGYSGADPREITWAQAGFPDEDR